MTHEARLAEELVSFIAASPSPFHCAAESARRLDEAGFVAIPDGGEPSPIEPGQGAYILREGSIIAWRAGTDAPAAAGFRILGAHTDSPNLRLKPRPDSGAEGWRQLAVEPYGGVLMHTWTDRDLGLSGAVMVRAQGRVETRLFRCDEPLARIANLAIHLNREVNTAGLTLNAQKHLPPLLGLGKWAGLRPWLQDRLGVDEILGFELGLHDTQAPCIGGIDRELIFAPRLDNQGSCYPALAALIEAAPARATQVAALFDHEEIGSRTWRGAMGPFLRDVLGRIVRDHRERASGDLLRATANSFLVSSDMAHAVHPNYADRHEPEHKPRLNGGPVIKTHVEGRYATDGYTGARFRMAAADCGVAVQEFVTRSDLPCGTTIGPISAGELGIRAVDVGNPMLSMHSIREQAGVADVAAMTRVMRHVLES